MSGQQDSASSTLRPRQASVMALGHAAQEKVPMATHAAPAWSVGSAERDVARPHARRPSATPRKRVPKRSAR